MSSTSHEHRKKRKGLILSLKRKAKDYPGSNVPVSLNIKRYYGIEGKTISVTQAFHQKFPMW